MSRKFLIIASHARSLSGFRKPFIQALLDEGITVHAAAPELLINGKVKGELEAMGVTLHDVSMARTGMNPLFDMKTLWILYRLMKQIKPDYTMGYTIKPVVYGSLAASLARVPNRFALVTGLGYAFVASDDRKKKLINRIVVKLYRLSLSKVKCVFFQNSDDEELFKELKIVSGNIRTTVVAGSGVPVDEYQFKRVSENKQNNFFLMARLLKAKGIRVYTEAARIVKKQHPSANFMLAGALDGRHDSISQDELNGWIAKGLIDYRGTLDNVKQALEESSVFVLPSFYREGVPRSILEALATGRAIITTDAPGCRETVIEGENGFLVPVKDTKALAKAMLKFIEEPELVATMGKRSRQLAEDKFDVHKVNAHMLYEMGIRK